MPCKWAKGCVFDDCVGLILLDKTTLFDGGRKSRYIIIISIQKYSNANESAVTSDPLTSDPVSYTMNRIAL